MRVSYHNLLCAVSGYKNICDWLNQDKFFFLSETQVSPPHELTAVQLVYNPFRKFVSQAQLYSQLQLSLWSDPITFSVPKFS